MITALVAGLLAGSGVLVATLPPGTGAAARLRALRPAGPRPGSARHPGARSRAATAAAVLAAAGVAAALPTALGLLLCVPVGALTRSLLRRLERGGAPAPAVLPADVPPALDLLASCLAAGADLPDALSVVGDVSGDPLRALLGRAARSLRLGAPPDVALEPLRGQPELAAAADLLARAVLAGTAPAEPVVRLAEVQRRRSAEAARAAGRRAGVLVVLPLGLCFLPAFVLLGVVPVVAGVATSVVP